MKAIVYNKLKKSIHAISNNVSEVGKDFVVGDVKLKGINTDVLEIIAVDDDTFGDEIKNGDTLPPGLVDKKSLLVKPTLEDLMKELALEKIEKIQLKNNLSLVTQELAKTKIDIIQIKGGAAV